MRLRWLCAPVLVLACSSPAPSRPPAAAPQGETSRSSAATPLEEAAPTPDAAPPAATTPAPSSPDAGPAAPASPARRIARRAFPACDSNRDCRIEGHESDEGFPICCAGRCVDCWGSGMLDDDGDGISNCADPDFGCMHD